MTPAAGAVWVLLATASTISASQEGRSDAGRAGTGSNPGSMMGPNCAMGALGSATLTLAVANAADSSGEAGRSVVVVGESAVVMAPPLLLRATRCRPCTRLHRAR